MKLSGAASAAASGMLRSTLLRMSSDSTGSAMRTAARVEAARVEACGEARRADGSSDVKAGSRHSIVVGLTDLLGAQGAREISDTSDTMRASQAGATYQ